MSPLKSEPFSARIREWRQERGLVFIAPFSSKIAEGAPEGWPSVIDEGALDLVMIWRGGDFEVVEVSSDLPALFYGSFASEAGEEALRGLLTEENGQVVVFDERFAIPIMENAFGLDVEGPVLSLLHMVKEADAEAHEDGGRRIDLPTIFRLNRRGDNLSTLASYLPNTFERLRNWRIGGTRAVLMSMKQDIEMMVHASYGISVRGGIKVPARERSGSVFIADG